MGVSVLGRTLTIMNYEWALNELKRFLELTRVKTVGGIYADTYVGTPDEITAQRHIVEKICNRVLGPSGPVPLDSYDPWGPDRARTVRCITQIEREQEIRENLGEDAPDLNAATLHPWIWEGARSLWQSGHFAEAVAAAAKKLNAETQNRVGTRDLSETQLFNDAFSDSNPAVGHSRLRLPEDDDGRTAMSVRRGIRAFADGCFSAIRNPLAHENSEFTETEALERLAALSVLARWVSAAAVARHG